MDKYADSQTDHPAGPIRADRKSHLSDEQLLFALDGELSARESVQVKEHLEACWSCRTRSERIEGVIADVVMYRDQVERSFLPLSAGGRVRFAVRLGQLVQSAGRPSLCSHLMGVLRASRAFLQHSVQARVWISGLVIAIAVLSVARLWGPGKVSANQLLENAQASEVRALHGIAKPVVYQRLRIRIDNNTLTRTIYRDPAGLRRSDHLDFTGNGEELAKSVTAPGKRTKRPDSVDVADQIKQTFLADRLNWQDPLSPSSYRDWRNNLLEKKDEVSISGDNLLTLTTTTNEGPITEARLTLRTSDFHPIAEDLRLRDSHQVEVDELDWDVLPMEAISPAIFEPERAIASPETLHSANLTPPPSSPTDRELAEAELQARVAIHAEGADLGEQIELNRNTLHSPTSHGQLSVVVRGVVSTFERKKSLLAALQGIPHLDLRLRTVQEAVAQQDQELADTSGSLELEIPREASATESRVSTRSVEGSPDESPALPSADRRALEQHLKERYPERQDRVAFINGTLELAQDAVAQAWALRRLQDSYTSHAVAELSRGSQQTLTLLLRDHVSVLRQDVDAARNTVLPLFSTEPLAEVPSPDTINSPPPAAPAAGDWRISVTEIFPEVQKMNEDIATLLAGSSGEPSKMQALVRGLQLAFSELETQLPLLYQQVGEPTTGN